jgi:NAD(P)-dependent dehydrogenase (short-subunit alcohol dehydrogenase family)
MRELDGRTAVVTGAASGIGYALAAALLDEGMRVVAADVEAPALAEAAARLIDGRDPDTLLTVECDVTDAGAVEGLRDRAIERYGRVNLLCNNAGVGGVRGSIGHLDLSDWKWVLGVNLWGVIHGCEAFVPHLEGHGDGHIVNTASIAGHLSLPFMGPYNVAKHAVVTLSETMRHELDRSGSGVGVSVLCPGVVATRLIDADRNRPEHLTHALDEGDPTVREQERAVARELMAQKKPPAEVAQLVVDAVKSDTFWIFTDDQFAADLAERHHSIESATNPPPARTLLDYMLD